MSFPPFVLTVQRYEFFRYDPRKISKNFSGKIFDLFFKKFLEEIHGIDPVGSHWDPSPDRVADQVQQTSGNKKKKPTPDDRRQASEQTT
jgi:hypothetical protein